jgi:two-component system, OmpR family, sensor histidine kinase SenX3
VARKDGAKAPKDVAQRIPAGAEDVLLALRLAWVILGDDNRVIRRSPTAVPYGLVRGKKLRVDEVVELVDQVRKDGVVREIDLQVPRSHRGTELLTLDVRVAPLGECVLVLAEDQTAVRRVDAVRRDFVANVSHELKTPVGALALLAEAVQGSADDPDAVRRFSGRMQHEAYRLTQLVQDLISLSRLQTQDPLRDGHVVSVDDIVSDSVDAMHLEAEARQIRLEVRGQHGLTTFGDDDQLITAVRNLVSNAINYSPDHTRVTVTVQLVGKHDDTVEINVTDQGIGIPQRDLERIFERFYRVDPARSRATGGTGLGLSIVKHIVTNHGGDVSVWSSAGSGSTFTVRLPRHRVDQVPRQLPSATAGSHRALKRTVTLTDVPDQPAPEQPDRAAGANGRDNRRGATVAALGDETTAGANDRVDAALNEV